MPLEPWYTAAYAAPALVAGAVVVRAWRSRLTAVTAARRTFMERMGDAVLVLDEVDRVAAANPAALELLARGGRSRPVVGHVAADALGPMTGTLLNTAGEHAVDVGGSPVVLDVRSSVLTDARARPLGRVVLARDVTHERRRRDELARVTATVAEQAGTIQRLQAEVAEQAVRDPLTGLHDRRYLDAVLPRLVREATPGAPLSVVVLDADRLKAVTSARGRDVAEGVLRALAAELLAATRPGETLVRWGGGEFVLVLPRATASDALGRARELQRRGGRVGAAAGDGHAVSTLSAGVASTSPTRDTAEALLEAADVALCEAKRLGPGRLRAAAQDDVAVTVPAQHTGPRSSPGAPGSAPTTPTLGAWTTRTT